MTTNLRPAGVADGESHFISVGANRIHYVTVGKGSRTIVFVHGWACNLSFWREQVSALADKARLILIDLPGHGQSAKPQTAYTMDFFAEAVSAVLRDAKVDKAIFIGHSMGGAVIARVHHHAPEKVAALVSVDGLLCRLSGTPEEGQALVVPFGSPQYLDHARGFISTFFPVPGTEVLRERVMSEMLATPQHVMLGGMLAMMSPDQPDWILQKVNAPVVVINARSPWWKNGYENYVRSLSPQSDYYIMDGVGHFLMLEKPAEFNATLVEKLRKFDLIAE
ncbi:MAG TPA: alpha/beta hydrolase [Verrucomicrobiae bacterium]|jgi:pimeloyl-ACP methyl ester carboxylesterase|nr:alpha/beta hydrolase [Verrucomicrobiae bacterium]